MTTPTTSDVATLARELGEHYARPRVKRAPTPVTAAQRAARSALTYEQAAAQYQGGTLEDVWRWYVFFWTWAAVRFSGRAGAKQDRAFERLGRDAYMRRGARVRAMLYRLREEGQPNE